MPTRLPALQEPVYPLRASGLAAAVADHDEILISGAKFEAATVMRSGIRCREWRAGKSGRRGHRRARQTSPHPGHTLIRASRRGYRAALFIGFAFAVMADPVSSVAYTIEALTARAERPSRGC